MDLMVVGAILIGLIGVVAVAVLVLWLRRGQDVVVVPPVPPAQLSGDVPAEVQALLVRGQKIEAIKRVREMTGLGLKEAKDYVDSIQQGVSPAALSPVSPPPSGDPGRVEQEARQILATGTTISAIKRVRELTGLGLKEAKDYVDALQRGGALPALPATTASCSSYGQRAAARAGGPSADGPGAENRCNQARARAHRLGPQGGQGLRGATLSCTDLALASPLLWLSRAILLRDALCASFDSASHLRGRAPRQLRHSCQEIV